MEAHHCYIPAGRTGRVAPDGQSYHDLGQVAAAIHGWRPDQQARERATPGDDDFSVCMEKLEHVLRVFPVSTHSGVESAPNVTVRLPQPRCGQV